MGVDPLVYFFQCSLSISPEYWKVSKYMGALELHTSWTVSKYGVFLFRIWTHFTQWQSMGRDSHEKETFDVIYRQYQILTLFFSMFPFVPPENIRKPNVFWCFQWDQKGTLGRKGLKIFWDSLERKWFIESVPWNLKNFIYFRTFIECLL